MKDEQTKKDIQYIKNGWVLHISKSVVYSQLYKCLNDLISHGISSDYLVFVFNYVVKNNMPLRHPFGFKYFVDNPKIKKAYQKFQNSKLSHTPAPLTHINLENDAEEPHFKTKSNNSIGFGSILKDKHN